MDRNHRIRIAVSHLRGIDREKAIDYLLKHPRSIERWVYIRLMAAQVRGL